MKFTDGFWEIQKGYEIFYAAQAYEVTTTKNSITVLAPSAVIQDRGQTTNMVTLEITWSAAADNLIKVYVSHFKGGLLSDPAFELFEDREYEPEIQNREEYAQLVAGNTKVIIHKGSEWNVEYFYRDKKLTGGAWRSTSYVKESRYKAEARMALQKDDEFFSYPVDPHASYIREQLTLSVGECIYGFGERFTPFVKNGQAIELWNSDGGTCSEYAYKNIPFYISSRGYGVFVNSSDKVSCEVASETVSKVSLTLPGEEMEYFIIGGNDLHEVLSGYTSLTGKPALPPAYSFGLWLSTSFTTKYDEETVTSFIDGMADRDIPLQVFHFDCFWMKEFELCNLKWDPQQFPQPAEMLKRLRNKGIEICVWINPYVSQRSALFAIGKENGYFIKNPDGSVFQTDFWQPGLAIVDFTNPNACQWFTGLLKKLFDMGVNNIKTDFGERIPSKAVYYNGSDSVKMHNYYTFLYNKTVFEALEQYYGKNKACLFSRSATAGGQRFPVHWGGDCYSDYSSMAETLRGGLSLCSSGFGFFSHDIGGFEETASPDVYKRWCAFGLMSTHSRLHGSNSYRVPWLFDEESCDVLRFYVNLKGKLMPYLYSQAVKTHETGIPMMRSMIIEFMEDPVCKYLDMQYMLGDSLLIAPVMDASGDVEFYLPDGSWTDIVTGHIYKGGQYVKRNCSYTEMPVLARENSIIPFGDFEKSVVYDYAADADFKIYQLQNGTSASIAVYDSEAGLEMELKAEKTDNQVTITYTPTQKTFTVTLAEEKITRTADGNGKLQIFLS